MIQFCKVDTEDLVLSRLLNIYLNNLDQLHTIDHNLSSIFFWNHAVDKACSFNSLFYLFDFNIHDCFEIRMKYSTPACKNSFTNN